MSKIVELNMSSDNTMAKIKPLSNSNYPEVVWRDEGMVNAKWTMETRLQEGKKTACKQSRRVRGVGNEGRKGSRRNLPFGGK